MGGGAPQVGDLRLLEDGGERRGTLGPDVVVPETADEGRSGDGERVQACQRALTQKQIQSGGGAPQVGDLRLLEDGGEREGALSPDVVSLETTDERRSGDGERVASMATGADKKAGATECADAQARRNHTG